jgi:hypothetical protein
MVCLDRFRCSWRGTAIGVADEVESLARGEGEAVGVPGLHVEEQVVVSPCSEFASSDVDGGVGDVAHVNIVRAEREVRRRDAHRCAALATPGQRDALMVEP